MKFFKRTERDYMEGRRLPRPPPSPGSRSPLPPGSDSPKLPIHQRPLPPIPVKDDVKRRNKRTRTDKIKGEEDSGSMSGSCGSVDHMAGGSSDSLARKGRQEERPVSWNTNNHSNSNTNIQRQFAILDPTNAVVPPPAAISQHESFHDLDSFLLELAETDESSTLGKARNKPSSTNALSDQDEGEPTLTKDSPSKHGGSSRPPPPHTSHPSSHHGSHASVSGGHRQPSSRKSSTSSRRLRPQGDDRDGPGGGSTSRLATDDVTDSPAAPAAAAIGDVTRVSRDRLNSTDSENNDPSHKQSASGRSPAVSRRASGRSSRKRKEEEVRTALRQLSEVDFEEHYSQAPPPSPHNSLTHRSRLSSKSEKVYGRGSSGVKKRPVCRKDNFLRSNSQIGSRPILKINDQTCNNFSGSTASLHWMLDPRNVKRDSSQPDAAEQEPLPSPESPSKYKSLRNSISKRIRFGEKKQVEIHYGSFNLYAMRTSEIMDLATEYATRRTRKKVARKQPSPAHPSSQRASPVKTSPSKKPSPKKGQETFWKHQFGEANPDIPKPPPCPKPKARSMEILDQKSSTNVAWRVSAEELRFVQSETRSLASWRDQKDGGGSSSEDAEEKHRTQSQHNLFKAHSKSLLTLVEEFNKTLIPERIHTRRHVPCLISFVSSKRAVYVLGPLMGFLIYLYLVLLVLPGLPLAATFGTQKADNNTAWTDEAISQAVGGCVGFGAGVFLTVSGHNNAQVRTTMVLVFPTLISKRGRAFMLTSAFAILLTGPVHTIESNIQQVVESLMCLYEQMKTITEELVSQSENNFKQIEQIMADINKAVNETQEEMERLKNESTEKVKAQIEQLNKKMEQYQEDLAVVSDFMGTITVGCDSVVAVATVGIKHECGAPEIPNLPQFNISLGLDCFSLPQKDLVQFDHVAKSELHADEIPAIREKLKTILRRVFEITTQYFRYISKICYLSVFFMIYDSCHYMYRYYTDDSYDNNFVDHNLRNYAINIRNDHNLLPMRNWELKEKYQNHRSVKLSKREYKRIAKQSMLTIISLFAILAIVVGDLLLQTVLQVFRDEAKFGIEYDGLEQGMSLSSVATSEVKSNITIRMFRLSSDPCLPTPYRTDYTKMLAITALLFLCFMSCVFDAYASRLRPTVCNACFPKRAVERAAFLYKNIVNGRSTRRLKLQMIAYRRLEKKYRESQFRKKKHRARGLTGKKTTTECVGCSTHINKQDATKFPLKFFGESATVYICTDCRKDTNL